MGDRVRWQESQFPENSFNRPISLSGTHTTVVHHALDEGLIPAVVFLSMLVVASARGAFVNGVEAFDGTAKDLTTWEQYPSSGSGFSQNGALSITGAGDRDYTTRMVTISAGQRVTAEVRIDAPQETNTIYRAALLLTTNSNGTTKDSIFDSRVLGCQVTLTDPSAQSTGRYFESISGGNGGVGIKRFADGTPVSGQTYLLSVQRDSTTDFQVSASLMDGTLLFNDSYSFPAPDVGMYIALHHTSYRFYFDSVSTFDNVTITPEPSIFVAFLVLSLVCVSRRTRL